MNVRILYLSCNRAEYTRISLPRLLDTIPDNTKIVIWDNGSIDGTVDFLKRYEGHSKIDRIIYNGSNEGLMRPTNWFWDNYREAELLGKIDEDCLVSEAWLETLITAHEELENAGMLSCWIYRPEDFDKSLASRKLFLFGDHSLMVNCWVGGSGYLMKSSVIQKIGLLRPKETFTTYCIRAFKKGMINGWYFPFIYMEHMDDPRSDYFMFKDDDDFRSHRPLTAKNFKINSIDEWMNRLKNSAYRLQTCSIDPNDYIGIRSKIRKLKKRYLNKV